MLTKVLFSLTTICFCIWCNLSPAQAANWFYLFEGETGVSSYYWDTDAYTYDPKSQLTTCGYRILNKKTGEDYQVVAIFDLKRRKAAFQSLKVYEQGQLVHNSTNTKLSFRKVSHGSNEDYIFSLLKLAEKLTENKIDWEFNTLAIPEASPLDSPNWDNGGGNALNASVDKSSKYVNAKEKGGWIRMGNTLQWYRFDLVRDRLTIAAQKVYQKGKVIGDFKYPLLLWSDRGLEYSSKTQKLFLDQSIICFRMQEGVQLDK